MHISYFILKPPQLQRAPVALQTEVPKDYGGIGAYGFNHGQFDATPDEPLSLLAQHDWMNSIGWSKKKILQPPDWPQFWPPPGQETDFFYGQPH